MAGQESTDFIHNAFLSQVALSLRQHFKSEKMKYLKMVLHGTLIYYLG